MKIFEKLDTIQDFNLNEKFSGTYKAAVELAEKLTRSINDLPAESAGRKFFEELSHQRGEAFAKLKELGEKTRDGFKPLATLDATQKEAFQAAKKSYDEMAHKVGSFLRGDEVTLADNKFTVPTEIKDAYLAAEKATNDVMKTVNGRVAGALRTQGWKAALDKNMGSVKSSFDFAAKDMSLAQRGVGFAKVGAVGVAAVGMGDAMFRSKLANGEDRSVVTRLVEFVAAGAVGTYALLGGRAAAPAL